ncbi:MAG: heavy-metal-associated domain-containing protein [Acutalibacteraceae bacterium]
MKKIIKVEGMHCGHCEKAVEDALKEVDGVTKAKADKDKAEAVAVMKNDIDEKLLFDAIEKAGFKPGEVTVKKDIFGR